MPKLPYEVGIEIESGTEGWAIYTGINGEVGDFSAFVVNKKLAEHLLTLKQADGDDLFFDASIMPAIVTESGLITSNDFEIDTHKKLRAHLAKPDVKATLVEWSH